MRRASRTARVRYVAEDAPTGYGDAADRLVRAVRASGVDVEYRGWSATLQGAEPALVPFSRDDRPGDVAPVGAPTVAHLVPEYYPLVRSVLDGGPFVAHTVWETDRAPKHWPDLLNATDLVVVPTSWNRDVFVGSGVEVPVRVVPHVVCDPMPGDGGAALGIPDDVFVFYSIGRWDQRKAMFHTVRAFLEAFTADDPVMLVVKTGATIEMAPSDSWAQQRRMTFTTGSEVARLVSRYRNPARVQLEPGTWTDDRIAGLHTRGDCYVTLARGEGWGIGAFDACAYGTPVVATGWGGFLEYLDPTTAYLVGSELVAVDNDAYASYSPDQRWAEPNLDHAVEHLRAIVHEPEEARSRAGRAQAHVQSTYSPERVAERFLETLSDWV